MDKEVGYRWLREGYLRHRRSGGPAAEAEALLGFSSVRVAVWEAEVANSERHHLRVDVGVETAFWTAYESGVELNAAASSAGVGRSTAYRWLERRFDELRAAGMTWRSVQRLLRLSDRATRHAEQRRRDQVLAERRAAQAARRDALRSSRGFADQAAGIGQSEARRRGAARNDAYWQLMRSGETNVSASRLLGMHRHSGTNIRRAHQH